MANDDSRYVGAFFNSYTNTRMKLHRHCVPLEDDPEKIAKIYGYDRELVYQIFAELKADLRTAANQLESIYRERLDRVFSGRAASLVFIGDQLTSDYLSYFHIVEKLLEPYETVRVSIAGNTGDTSNQSIQYVYGLAVSKDPVVTSIWIGINDVYQSDDIFSKAVCSREEYAKNVDYLVKVMMHNGSGVILNTLPPVDPAAAKKAYAQMNWKIDNEEIAARNRILREIAEKNKCVLNDIASKFREFDGNIQIPENGILLTKEAQAYMAGQYLERLLSVLE